MKNRTDCNLAVKVAEHEYECIADQYDIDEKTCFVPRDEVTHDEKYSEQCVSCGPDYCEI